MRHASSGRRLGRTTSHRIAMFRNMVTSLLQHEKITTTDSKAKELRPITEKLITLGKRGDLHAVRQAATYIRDKKVVTKLFETIAPRYKERDGGYTRIIKLGIRQGDNANVSIIELVEEQFEKKPTRKLPVTKTIAPAVVTAVQAAAVAAPEPEETESAQVEAPLSEISEPSEQCEAKAD
jgi:large subunit ribosomal protein L17